MGPDKDWQTKHEDFKILMPPRNSRQIKSTHNYHFFLNYLKLSSLLKIQ